MKQELAKELMKLDDDHEVLFLHGGASTQFLQVPMNLLNENETAAYLIRGVWANKSHQRSKNIWKCRSCLQWKRIKTIRIIPKEFHVPPTAKYLHITTNNTIDGTQMAGYFLIPQIGCSAGCRHEQRYTEQGN